VVYDLESALRGVYLDKLKSAITGFFANAQIEVLSVGKDDFAASIENALSV
jgi:hypothetical protein